MKRFKKRNTEKKLEKTLTILDSETKEVKEVIDIVEEPKEIILEDEDKEITYSETQLKDMSFMTTLRDSYPELTDIETVLTDACKSHKLMIDEKNKQLSDEEKRAEEKTLDKIAEADGKQAKILADAAIKEQEARVARQLEIEEAERKRHDAAQNK